MNVNEHLQRTPNILFETHLNVGWEDIYRT